MGVLLMMLAPVASAQESGYVQIITAKGAIQGESKDPGHLGWVKVNKVQYVARTPMVTTTSAVTTSAAPKSQPVVSGNVTRPDKNAMPGARAVAGSTASVNGTLAGSAATAAVPKGGAQPDNPLRDSRSNHVVNPQRIIFVKDVDKLSPRLKQALAQGEKFDQVIVDFYRGGSPVRITLKDAKVYSIQPFSSESQKKHPVEVVSFVAFIVPRQN